jgi:1-acyl-sn-glycerol-3-phosphate acyltransferase
LRVRHAERFPSRGGALLVANHPATWTDVIVLKVALGRKLRFLAHETLFRPMPRGWLLRIYGALPVARRDDAGDHAARNDETFRRCVSLMACGQVVALFPEGLSAGDRSLLPFHTGAARIANGCAASGLSVRVVPVGLHYADRTALRDDVVVGVGRPIEVAAECPTGELTARLREAIARLIVELPDRALRGAVEELAALAPGGSARDPAAFGRSRCLARRLGRLRREDPQRFVELCRRVGRHKRLRERLGLSAVALEPVPRTRHILRAIATALLAPAALAGLLLNVPPAALTALHVRRFRDPARVTLARVAGGGPLFLAWYLGLGVVGGTVADDAWLGIAGAAAAAALGGLGLVWKDGWRRLRGDLRIAWLRRRHPGPLVRLAREGTALRGLVAGSSGHGLPARGREVIA